MFFMWSDSADPGLMNYLRCRGVLLVWLFVRSRFNELPPAAGGFVCQDRGLMNYLRQGVFIYL